MYLYAILYNFEMSSASFNWFSLRLSLMLLYETNSSIRKLFYLYTPILFIFLTFVLICISWDFCFIAMCSSYSILFHNFFYAYHIYNITNLSSTTNSYDYKTKLCQYFISFKFKYVLFP